MSTNTQKINWPGWTTGPLLGRGSFGAVYEIQRDVFGDIEKAALKVISIPQNVSDIDEMYSDGYDDESITSTFQSHLKSIVAEYSLMRKMNGSANIVNCDDIRYVQHDDGIGWDIFIKMELLTPLTKALPAEITEETVVAIAKDMCAALELCKKHEIVHRDIKPQNIFVSPNGDYKLGDFGIAKTVEKTMGGTKIGTYKYMAPEVYNNQPYGSAADIYSLGLVLYWLLNERRMPFLPLPPAKLGAGMDEAARNRRFSGELLPPPAHGSDRLKQIVMKACAYDPNERYQSAAEMMADLNVLAGLVPTVVPPVVDIRVNEVDTYIDSVKEDTTCGPIFDIVSVDEDAEETVGPNFAPVSTDETTEQEETVGPAFIPKGKPEQPKKKKKIRAVIAVLAMIIIMLFWPVYGEWSDWSPDIPDNVKDCKMETAVQYRYREKVLVESDTVIEETKDVEFIKQWQEWSEYSDWSNWSQDEVIASNSCEVESEIRYRSRNVTAMNSYTDWSGWSGWSTRVATQSDTVEVQTRTVYYYEVYRYICACGTELSRVSVMMLAHARKLHGDGEHLDPLRKYIVGEGDVSLAEALASAGFWYESTTLAGINQKLSVDTSSSPYAMSDYPWFTNSAEPSRTETQYNVRTRELVNSKEYSEWTDYTTEVLKEDENTQVESNVFYRFRTRSMIDKYQYKIWGDWGNWEMNPKTVTADMDSEQREVYRYAYRCFLWQRIVDIISKS